MPDMTITTSAGDAARVAAAVGRKLGLVTAQGAPRSATAAEVKVHVVEFLKATVQDQERLAALEAQQAGFSGVNPT